MERHHRLGPNGLLAMTLTAMIVFIQANIWPIVTLELNGRPSSTTLWGTIITMWQQHAEVVAVIAAATLFFFPLIKMLLFGWVFWFARRGERGPGFRPAMIALHYLRPWTMSEVFVLGAMVAIVKARVYFDVIPDPGIFAYGALMLLITVFGTIDLRQLWDVTRERGTMSALPRAQRTGPDRLPCVRPGLPRYAYRGVRLPALRRATASAQMVQLQSHLGVADCRLPLLSAGQPAADHAHGEPGRRR